MKFMNENEIAISLEKMLNYHGHSFQYSVVAKAEELNKAKKTEWQFYGTELPVNTQGKTTHVDIIFKHSNENVFLICECKRADPAKAHWSFVKSPFTFDSDFKNFGYFDYLRMRKISQGAYFPSSLTYGCNRPKLSKDIYHLGYELKTKEKGDGSGSSRQSAINDAVTQVFRSSSGFMNYLFSSQRLTNIYDQIEYYFIPAIFTTARISASDSDISTASLKDGLLPKGSVNIKEEGWLWMNSNRSSELKHSLTTTSIPNMFIKPQNDIVRSVAIINDEGFESFFSSSVHHWLNPDK